MNSASMIRLNPNNPSVVFLLVLVTCLQPTNRLINQLSKHHQINQSIKKTKTKLTAQTASACEAGTARRRQRGRRFPTIGGAWWRRKAGPLGKTDDEQEQSNGRVEARALI
jgi:hypothetical protein